MYHHSLFDMIESIIELIEQDDINTYLRFLEDAVPYMDKYHYTEQMRSVVNKISVLLKDKSVGTTSDRALLLDYQAILEKSNAKAIQLEKRAVNMITEINKDNAWLAANLHSNLGMYYMKDGQLELARQYMENSMMRSTCEQSGSMSTNKANNSHSRKRTEAITCMNDKHSGTDQ